MKPPLTNRGAWLLLLAVMGMLAPHHIAHGQAQRRVQEPQRKPDPDESGEDEEDEKPEPKPEKPTPPTKSGLTDRGDAPDKAAKEKAPEAATELSSEDKLEEAKKQAKDLEEEEALQEASDVARAKELWQKIELGGALEAEVGWRRNFDGTSGSDLALKTAEFDFAVRVVDWALAGLAAEWDPDADKITLNEGLVTLGRLRKFPLQLQIGRGIVPFGISTGATVAARLEDILTISDPLSKAVFESKQDHALLRFRVGGFGAGAYLFNGRTNSRGSGGEKHVGHYGGTLGYAGKHGALVYSASAYFIDSVFDSDSLLSAFPEARTSRYAPGAAAVVRLVLSRFSPEASGDAEEFEKLADEQEEEEEEDEEEEKEKDKEAEDEEDDEEDWQ